MHDPTRRALPAPSIARALPGRQATLFAVSVVAWQAPPRTKGCSSHSSLFRTLNWRSKWCPVHGPSSSRALVVREIWRSIGRLEGTFSVTAAQGDHAGVDPEHQNELALQEHSESNTSLFPRPLGPNARVLCARDRGKAKDTRTNPGNFQYGHGRQLRPPGP